MTDGHGSSITVLRALLLVGGTLSVLLVLPFLQSVLAGGLMAYLVVPVSDRLSRRLGPTASAALTMLATIVVLVPLLLLLGVVLDHAVSLVEESELPDVGVIETLLHGWIKTNAELSSLAGPLSGAIETGFRGLVGRLVGILGGIPAFLVGAVIFSCSRSSTSCGTVTSPSPGSCGDPAGSGGHGRTARPDGRPPVGRGRRERRRQDRLLCRD